MTGYLIIAGVATIVLFSMTGSSSGCGILRDCIEGSNERGTETRTVGAPGSFTGIKLDGSMDVLVTEGPFSVRVEGENNLLELVRTEVVDNDLVVSGIGCFSSRQTLVVHVSMPHVERLTINGSGDMRSVSRITSNALAVMINGSGDISLDVEAATLSTKSNGSGTITLKGNATALTAVLNGSGDLKTAGLASDRVTYNSNGSGDGEVTAGSEIHARIAGSGDLVYHGSPAVDDTAAPGSGDIRRIP